MTIQPERLQQFALAYAPSVLRAVRELESWTGDLSPEAYAVAMTEAMTSAVARGGIQAIQHYYLNSRGKALQFTCTELGLEVSILALDAFLAGR